MTAVASRSIGRGARVSEPDYVSFGSRPCLRRHGAGRLRDRKGKDDKSKHSDLKAPEPGHINIDLKYLPRMANETSRGYLIVAINWATQWVFIGMRRNKAAANA